MKIYFLETNAYNSILIVEGDQAKVISPDSSGCINGIDLYTDDAVIQLQNFYKAATPDSFDNINGQSISLSDIDTDRDIDPDKLTLLYKE